MNTFIRLFIYSVSDSGIITYILTCETGNLVIFTSSLVVRVESFESVYQDYWLDSKMSFLTSKLLCNLYQ